MKEPTVPERVPLRVLCVDDNRDLLATMRMLINAEAHMVWAGCLFSADRMLQHARALTSGRNAAKLLVLLDAVMPGKDAFVALREMVVELPDVRAIVLTGRDDPDLIARAMRAGACACISKRDEPDIIMDALRTLTGKAWL